MGAFSTVDASALADTNNGALTIPGFTPRETRFPSTAHTQVVDDSKECAVALRFLRWYFSVGHLCTAWEVVYTCLQFKNYMTRGLSPMDKVHAQLSSPC